MHVARGIFELRAASLRCVLATDLTRELEGVSQPHARFSRTQ
jgi:hypothetical protein